MIKPVRIAFIHTGAVVIAPVIERAGRALPDATFINYLDDRIVADLRDDARAESVPLRVNDLVQAAKRAGAEYVVLTCSSISELAAPLTAEAGIPVLRIDEAMADKAVASGQRITVLATLATTCEPTVRLLRERAALTGAAPTISSEVIDGAFAAVASGDRATHDELVASAVDRVAAHSDVVVLAQASMASAAASARTAVPVLTSIEAGIERLRSTVSEEGTS